MCRVQRINGHFYLNIRLKIKDARKIYKFNGNSCLAIQYRSGEGSLKIEKLLNLICIIKGILVA